MKEIARIQPKHRKAKVLSFSLFGNRPVYLIGAIRNVELQPRFYPEWHCRFYVAEDLYPPLIDELTDADAEIIIMRPEPEMAGMFWRFLAMGDQNLDASISLDADSRLTERLEHATKEWLNSDKAYHIMRDHPVHRCRIMGGLFGAKKNSLVALNMRQEIENFMSHKKRINQTLLGTNKAEYIPGSFKRGTDQVFLKKRIYPRIKEHALIHTDYQLFPGEKITPFPTPKKSREDFVGRQCCYDEPWLALKLAMVALKKLYLRFAYLFSRYGYASLRLYIRRKI